MHALCKQKFTPIFAPSSQSKANRLSLVPLGDLELTDTLGTWSSGSFRMGFRVQASVMPCNQVMMNELISML